MRPGPDPLAHLTPEQIAQTREWIKTWEQAGPELERIRRRELREMDTYETLARLCGDFDYTVAPRAPKPWSGLVEQQYWFMKAARRE